jgi:ABC-2 type transport system permease protein
MIISKIQHSSFSPFLRRTLAISEKETFHILRDMRALAVSFVLPIVLLVLFGYGVSFDLNRAPVNIVDLSQTPASQDLVRNLTAQEAFVAENSFLNPADVVTSFRRSETLGAVVIPKDFALKIKRGETAEVQLLIDGSSGTVAASLMGDMALFLQREQNRLNKSKNLAAPPLPIQTTTTLQYNSALRSSVFFVPGLVAFILAIVAVLLTSLTIAKEWERGQMEQLFATPVSRLEVVLGKLLPYLVIGCLQALLVLSVGMGVFDVPIKGNPVLLALAILLFMIGMLGHGLFLSVVTRNQMLATMAAAMTTILPTLLLSGFLYPISNMPKILQALSLIFPARYFMTILRGLLLKGSSFADLWPHYLGLALFAFVIIAAARARFVRRIA